VPCNLAYLLVSPVFLIIADLLVPIFYSHTLYSWHCLLLHPLNITHSLPSRPLCPSTLTLQGDTTDTLHYSDWSDNDNVSLSLAGQFKNSQIKLKFPWGKRPTT